MLSAAITIVSWGSTGESSAGRSQARNHNRPTFDTNLHAVGATPPGGSAAPIAFKFSLILCENHAQRKPH